MSSVKSVWLKDGRWACKNHCPSARFLAEVEKCLLGCDVSRPAPIKPKLVLVRSDDYASWTLRALRKYAANELGIKGASKILGGKKALIEVIKQTEKTY